MRKISFPKRILICVLAVVLIASISMFSFSVFSEDKTTVMMNGKISDEEDNVIKNVSPIPNKQVCITTPILDDEEKAKQVSYQTITEIDLPSIEPLKNLTVKETTNSSVTLTWDESLGVTGYNVYYKEEAENDYHYIYSTSSLEVSIGSLRNGTVYCFKVAPFVDSQGEIFEGPYEETKTCTSAASIGKLYLYDSSDTIGFSWSKVSGAEGYVIERSCDKTGGAYEYMGTIKDPDTTYYEDSSVEKGKAYFYRVTPYNQYNGEYAYSDYTTIRTISGLTDVDLSVTSQVRRVSLQWDDINIADGYDIYMSTVENGAYSFYESTSDTYYNTARLIDNKEYFFKVIPYEYYGDYKIQGIPSYDHVVCTHKAYSEDVGTRYIEVSLRQQKLFFYIDDELFIETDVVTGNVGARATPKGCHTIFQKASPCTLVGEDYRTVVKYWLGFTYSGCGIHDATWRSSFGGKIYTYDGSHGCVNTPYDEVARIYDEAEIGDYVVVY